MRTYVSEPGSVAAEIQACTSPVGRKAGHDLFTVFWLSLVSRASGRNSPPRTWSGRNQNVPELFPRRAFELVTPPGAAGEPRLWIERFCLWTDQDQPTRQITFKAGLNIIWSPDSSEGDKAIGHGAGKTTLCRLLRFCLGENTFAPKEQQDLSAD